MPKKIRAKPSKLSVNNKNAKPALAEWNKYAEKRIKDARDSERIPNKKIIVNT